MLLTSALDTLLDRLIVPGYTRPGLAIRKRLPDWPADPPRMDGKIVLVTGAASGLGLAACVGFARLGASVRALGRRPERAADAVAQVQEAVPGADVTGVHCDLSSVAALHDFVARFTKEEDRLDVLVNNAGVMPAEREHTVDGVEMTFAVHVVATHVLTGGLVPLLEATAPARVINVSSGGMYSQGLRAGDLQSQDDPDYNPERFYARSKRAQVVLTEQWAQKLKGTGVAVHSMHPGWAETPGVATSMETFLKVTKPIIRDAEQGADTIVWLGGAPDPMGSTGLFWHDRRPRPTHYLIGPGAESQADRDVLWREVERLASAAPAPARPATSRS